MDFNIDDLLIAVRELKMSVDEAKNLVFNGKFVQCDRKLQGCQVRCDNIFQYLIDARTENAVDEENNNEASEERSGDESSGT